jgi:hypothetical protein
MELLSRHLLEGLTNTTENLSQGNGALPERESVGLASTTTTSSPMDRRLHTHSRLLYPDQSVPWFPQDSSSDSLLSSPV